MGGQAVIRLHSLKDILSVIPLLKSLKMADEKKSHTARNYVLGGSGVMRFSHSTMYHKRGVFALKDKGAEKAKKPMVPKMVEKEIKGDNNGGKRVVRASKMPKSMPTQQKGRKLAHRKQHVRQHKHKLRASITPGTVLILLAGRHKGKRVVFLKQLPSGLLLVTGPFKVNGVPLRRVPQSYVIATQMKIDTSSLTLPESVTEEMFNR